MTSFFIKFYLNTRDYYNDPFFLPRSKVGAIIDFLHSLKFAWSCRNDPR